MGDREVGVVVGGGQKVVTKVAAKVLAGNKVGAARPVLKRGGEGQQRGAEAGARVHGKQL